MPTYEYKCGACGHRFERFQSITADPIRVCPACKKRKVRRLLGTGGAVLFKGSGFHATDYRSASYKEAARKESGAGKGSDAGKKKAADGKPGASKD
jgi:putative FmdB family regulatory protein